MGDVISMSSTQRLIDWCIATAADFGVPLEVTIEPSLDGNMYMCLDEHPRRLIISESQLHYPRSLQTWFWHEMGHAILPPPLPCHFSLAEFCTLLLTTGILLPMLLSVYLPISFVIGLILGWLGYPTYWWSMRQWEFQADMFMAENVGLESALYALSECNAIDLGPFSDHPGAKRRMDRVIDAALKNGLL